MSLYSVKTWAWVRHCSPRSVSSFVKCHRFHKHLMRLCCSHRSVLSMGSCHMWKGSGNSTAIASMTSMRVVCVLQLGISGVNQISSEAGFTTKQISSWWWALSYDSFQVFPCPLAVSAASYSRSLDTCRPRQQNLVLLHCYKGWEHTWIRRCCRLTLLLHWPLWCYCTFQRGMKNASKPHHQASRFFFKFLKISIYLPIYILSIYTYICQKVLGLGHQRSLFRYLLDLFLRQP